MVKMMMWLCVVSLVVVASRPLNELSRREVDFDCHRCKCTLNPKKNEVYVKCRGDGPGLNYFLIVPPNTVRLDMSHNNFKHIKQDTFTVTNTLENLRILKLSNSAIANIDKNAFKNTGYEKSVRHLDLSRNKLTNTKKLIALLMRFKKLIYVDVRENTCINCSELRTALGRIPPQKILCDDSCKSITPEVPLTTTSMIHLNRTPNQLPVYSTSRDDTTTSSTTIVPLFEIPSEKQTHPATEDTEDKFTERDREIEKSLIVVILIVAGCFAVIVVLIFCMIRRKGSYPYKQPISEIQNEEAFAEETDDDGSYDEVPFERVNN